MNVNSTIAALLGSLIGGVIGIIGTIITIWATFEKESKSFRRNHIQKHVEEIISAYSFALNVFFNLKRNGQPDRASYGEVYVKLSLLGSDKVKSILNEIIQLPPDKKADLDIERIIAAMQDHIKELKSDLK